MKRIIKLDEKLLLVCYLLMLSCLLIARDVFTVPINKFVYLVVCVIFLILADETYKLSMFSFLMPLMCGIPSTYVLLILMLLFIYKNRLKTATVILCAVYAFIELAALPFINMPLNNDVIQQILFVSVFFAMLYTVEKVNYIQCMKLYFLGAILVSFVIDAYTIIRAPSNWLTLFAKGWFRFGSEGLDGIEGMTLRLNPISYGFFTTTAVLIGLVLVPNTKKWGKIATLCGLAFLTISAFLAISRSFVIVVSGCLALVLFEKIRYVKNLGKIVGVLCIVSIIGIVLFKIYPELFYGMISRMTSSSMEGGNGRVELMDEYITALLNDSRRMIMGTGATFSMYAIGATTSIHNAIIQILISYGIWAGIAFIIAMLYPLSRSKDEGKAEFIYWIPLIGTLIYMQTIQFLNPCYLMMPYVMAVYALKEGRRQGAHRAIKNNRSY